MTNQKFYNPADVNSSPYEPMIGSLVIYHAAKATSLYKQLWPGIITNIHNTADDRVDITVFSNQGIIHLTRVPFSRDPVKEHVWDWMEAPKRRDVQVTSKVTGSTETSSVEALVK